MATDLVACGLYPDRPAFDQALEALRAAGFRNSDISAILPERDRTTRDLAHEIHSKVPEGVATGAGTGAATRLTRRNRYCRDPWNCAACRGRPHSRRPCRSRSGRSNRGSRWWPHRRRHSGDRSQAVRRPHSGRRLSDFRALRRQDMGEASGGDPRSHWWPRRGQDIGSHRRLSPVGFLGNYRR